jgi:hypothetical protein
MLLPVVIPGYSIVLFCSEGRTRKERGWAMSWARKGD